MKVFILNDKYNIIINRYLVAENLTCRWECSWWSWEVVVLAVVVVVSGALVVVTGLHVIGGCHGVVGLGVALCVVVVGLAVVVVEVVVGLVVVGAMVVVVVVEVVLVVVVVGKLTRYAWKSMISSDVGGAGSYIWGSFSPETEELFIFSVYRYTLSNNLHTLYWWYIYLKVFYLKAKYNRKQSNRLYNNLKLTPPSIYKNNGKLKKKKPYPVLFEKDLWICSKIKNLH